MKKNLMICLFLAASISPLSGCAAIIVADAAVGTAVGVGKTAVNTTVGAGKIVAKGVGATARAVTPNMGSKPQTCYERADGTLDCYAN